VRQRAADRDQELETGETSLTPADASPSRPASGVVAAGLEARSSESSLPSRRCSGSCGSALTRQAPVVPIVPEQVSGLPPSAVDASLDAPERHVGHRSDLVVGQPLDISQYEH